MPKHLADKVEQWAEEHDVTVERTDDPPRIKAYLCDGAYVDATERASELERRQRRATKVVALYTDGAREVRKDGGKN